MNGDQIDLDAIEARAKDTTTPEAWTHTMREACYALHARRDVPALIAEVRRLRAEVDRLNMAAGMNPAHFGASS